MRHPVGQPPVAILAYGSLIGEPGVALDAVIERRTPCRTPFPVEYARSSPRWGGGPVLTPHPDGGPVDGCLLHLAAHVDVGTAIDLLSEREGVESARGIVAVAGFGGGLLVLSACLDRNLPAPDMEPRHLAARAVASAATGPRNGIAYVARAVEAGILTPRTREYVAAILSLTGARSLEEAQRLVA
ncbi:MAG TPA: hypothetical protein PKE32_02910 [Miltoncostaeaceae bacterium]|nr:hypothetical protein [Miltoncostaeaceae bacterium]